MKVKNIYKKIIPCKDCICVPICRNKPTCHLVSQCSIVDKFCRHTLYGRERGMISSFKLHCVVDFLKEN